MASTSFHLPNLPGVRRDPLESPPKIFSKSRPRGLNTPSPNAKAEKPSVFDESILLSSIDSYNENASVFPKNANA